jgi:hypothetical protein
MHDRVTAGNCAAQRVDLQQVTGYGLGREAGEIFELAGGADEDA